MSDMSIIIITEIYFTLSRSSRTNSQEKSTHAGGTISVIVIMRPIGDRSMSDMSIMPEW